MSDFSLFKLFCSGYLASSAVHSLYQDIVGKDNYLMMVQHGWVSGWITVPLAILLLFASLALFDSAKKGQK